MQRKHETLLFGHSENGWIVNNEREITLFAAWRGIDE